MSQARRSDEDGLLEGGAAPSHSLGSGSVGGGGGDGEPSVWRSLHPKGGRRGIALAAAAGLLAVAVVVAAVVAIAAAAVASTSRRDFEGRLSEVLAHGVLIDGHNDLPMRLRDTYENQLSRVDLERGVPAWMTDFPRLREGHVGGQFWSVFVPCNQPTPAQATLEQIDVVHRLVERYPEHLQLALTAADVRRAHDDRRIASLIGMEGGHSINNSLALLRITYAAGARYMTLTHNCDTAWASWHQTARAAPDNGLIGPFGRQLVGEMNRLGMLVDLSHVSEQTMRDVLAVAEAPVIFSHSGSRAVCNHTRNVPAAVLPLVRKNGGVVMVNFYPLFVSEAVRRESLRLAAVDPPLAADEQQRQLEEFQRTNPDRATVHTVVDHIDSIVDLAGVDHVGIGSDFDGIQMVPEGLEDVSRYPALVRELMRRSYSDDDIKKIIGGNLLRAMARAEHVARSLQRKEQPSEAALAPPELPEGSY